MLQKLCMITAMEMSMIFWKKIKSLASAKYEDDKEPKF